MKPREHSHAAEIQYRTLNLNKIIEITAKVASSTLSGADFPFEPGTTMENYRREFVLLASLYLEQTAMFLRRR